MGSKRTYKVKEVSRLTGVSVRTLHHYDEIGLLVPSGRSRAGYRIYAESDLFRLQQILLHRELGFSLEDVRRLLDDPAFDQERALREQRREIERRIREGQGMLRAIDAALMALRSANQENGMTMEGMFEGFDPNRYEEEARERYGKTEAYRESKRRTARYTADDWRELAQEQQAIYADAMSAMKDGVSPSAERAMVIAEQHRESISRWFYPCTLEIHASLADLYESDARFTDNIDKYGVGLASFLSAAIRANAKRGT